MFVANKEFLNYLLFEKIEGKDTTVDKVEVEKELSDFAKKIGVTSKTVEVKFKEPIIKTSAGLTEYVSIEEEVFYKCFNYKVVTFCNIISDEDVDDHEGDLLFEVPLTWLVETINKEEKEAKEKHGVSAYQCGEIKNIDDFMYWTNLYTHMDGERIYYKALEENMIVGSLSVEHCDCCKETI